MSDFKRRLAALLLPCLLAFGEAAPAAPPDTGETATTTEEEKQTQQFAGLEFGVGISATFDIGSNDRVTEAELVNGIVRVTERHNTRARIMLESHYFFLPKGSPFGLEHKKWGIGPFIALQPGDDEIVEAVALGVMIGFRREGTSQSFNLGFGMVVDPNTRILGDGIKANQPLPAGETEIRYLQREQVGTLLLASFSF